MSEQKPVSLAGQQARIKFEAADDGFVVLFGPDVSMRWMGAINTSSNARADLHPEITGSLNTEEDYSAIKGAE